MRGGCVAVDSRECSVAFWCNMDTFRINKLLINYRTASRRQGLNAPRTDTALVIQNTQSVKGIVHPKMKIVSSFTQPQVDPNLYECVCSEHKGRYSEE